MKKLLMCCTLLLISLSFISCKERASQEEVVSSAKQLIEEKKYDTSEIILKNFLAENASAHQARELLAITFAQQGKYLDAVAQFTKIPSQLSATGFKSLIESLYMENESLDLISQYEKYAAINPNIPLESQIVYAISKTRLNKEKTLISQLSKSVNEDKEKSLIPYLIVATAEFENDLDTPSYLEKLKKGLTLFPNESANWFYLQILSTIASSQSEHAYAAEILDKLSTLRPSENKVKIFIAQELVKSNQFSKAEVQVDKILKTFDKQPIANQLKAILLVVKNDLPAAKIYIERAINGGYESRYNFLLAGEINFLLENYEQAITQLERGVQGGTSVNRFYDMLIYARAITNNEQDIINNVEKSTITNMAEISNVSSLIAGLYKSGKIDQIENIVDTINISPNVDPVILLETSVFKIGAAPSTDIAKSIDASKLVLARYERGGSDYTKDQIYFAKSFVLGELFDLGKFEEAKQKIQKWREIDKSDQSNLLFLASVYNASKNYNETITLLTPIENEIESADGVTMLAGAYFNSGQFENAYQTSKLGLSRFKYNIDMLKQFTQLEQKLNKNEENFILSTFADAKNSLSDALVVHFYYAIKQQHAKAINALEQLSESEKDSVLFWYTLAEANLAKNDPVAAANALNNLVNMKAPTYTHFQSVVATFNKLGNNVPKIKFIENNLTSFPGNDAIRIYLANVYTQEGLTDKGAALLKSIKSKSEALSVAKARNAVSAGKLNDAKELYKESMQEYGGITTVIPYAEFLRNISDTTQAIKVLSDFIKKNPRDVNSKVLLGTMSESDKAMALYKEALEISPNNFIALNNLAWQLYLQEDYKEAYSYAEQAYKLKPDNKEVENTYNTIKEKL